jgi:spoIIIJ-associated protein
VEWIVTTGRSVEEATEAALDQLGVADEDVEIEVLEEPKPGLFGRMRREARVRARVRPIQPPPKVDRRRGGRRTRKDKPSDESTSETAPATTATMVEERSERSGTAERSGSGGRKRRTPRPTRSETTENGSKGAPVNEIQIPLSEHAEMTRSFVEGLVDAFGYDADVTVHSIDEETAEVRVEGDELGLLIGRAGATLQAVQTLARSAAQRQREAVLEGRVFVEVGGYRQRRKEALERFTNQLVDEVVAAGVEKALEPMGSADRKVVHDAVNAREGVRTISVGEEPRRRVVIVPVED